MIIVYYYIDCLNGSKQGFYNKQQRDMCADQNYIPKQNRGETTADDPEVHLNGKKL